MDTDPVQYPPAVLMSLDGTTALEVLEYEGRERISNRDAVGYYFTVRLAPGGAKSRLCVMFSGTTLMYLNPKELGVPDFDNQEFFFVQVAEARIGQMLDEQGLPEPTPSGVPALQLPCFSDQIQEWKDRTSLDDDGVEDYVRSRLFWSWRFGHEAVVFSSPDYVRLGVDHRELMRLVNVGKDSEWIIEHVEPRYFTLKPTASLIQTERLRRKGGREAQAPQASASVFVNQSRLQELRDIQDGPFDLKRLVALCEELNVCAANDCVHAVAMLTRAIIDHVPPIFGAKTFAEVASSYAGARSFKESMAHLAISARKIADSHLHVQIRSKEVLPNRTQVDFSRDLDVLLAEIVRILS